MTLAVIAVAGYLIGSISFARLIGRIRLPGVDLAETDYPVEDTDEVWVYRGVSATSVLDRAGPLWGVAVIVLDALKALVPTLVVRLAWPDERWYLAVALAVVIGHIWPVWHRFEGGRGQSSILGALIVIAPIAIPLAMIAGAVFGIVALTSVYAARNGSAFFVVPWFALVDGFGATFAFAVALALVYLIALIPDIREERRVRRTLGTDSLPWRRRVRLAVAGFFSGED